MLGPVTTRCHFGLITAIVFSTLRGSASPLRRRATGPAHTHRARLSPLAVCLGWWSAAGPGTVLT